MKELRLELHRHRLLLEPSPSLLGFNLVCFSSSFGLGSWVSSFWAWVSSSFDLYMEIEFLTLEMLVC